MDEDKFQSLILQVRDQVTKIASTLEAFLHRQSDMEGELKYLRSRELEVEKQLARQETKYDSLRRDVETVKTWREGLVAKLLGLTVAISTIGATLGSVITYFVRK